MGKVFRLVFSVWRLTFLYFSFFSHVIQERSWADRTRGSAYSSTPTGRKTGQTAAESSHVLERKTSADTASPRGRTAREPSSSSNRAAGSTTSTATTGLHTLAVLTPSSTNNLPYSVSITCCLMQVCENFLTSGFFKKHYSLFLNRYKQLKWY